MIRSIIIALLLSSPALGAYPYDSVCRVEAGGSGVMIQVEGDKGLVVTNAHVMPDKAETVCYWPAVNQKRRAQVVGYHPELDLCFMVVDNPPVPAARTGVRDTHVIFAGFPHYDRARLHWQYGNVLSNSMVETVWQNKPVPGMSGGAVFDRLDGDFCGLVRGHVADEPIGIGVSDMALLTTSWRYLDVKTWVPNGEHVKDYEPSDWNYAKPSKSIITKVYSPDKTPHWKEKK